jgi:aminoglycoside 3-N-acetyltransferase
MTDTRATATRESIAADRARVGVEPGDVIFLHSSLKSLGWVEGGAEAVVDAFLDAVGAEGLIAVPTLTATFALGCMYRDLVVYAFDPNETPSRVGKITDTLWRRPNAYRSAHPTHSIAAIGKRAEELVRGHGDSSTFGLDSPYRRLMERGAKLLFLGVDLRCNTMLHAIEDWLDLPYMQPEQAVVKGPEGEPQVVTVAKCPMGDRDFYQRDSKVEQLLEQSGLIRRGQVAEAQIMWLPSQEMVRVVTEALRERPDLLLCDRPECEFCGKWRQPTRDHVRGQGDSRHACA